MEKLLTIPEAATLLGMSRWFLQKQIRLGRVKVVRLSHHSLRLRNSDLAEFVACHVTDKRPVTVQKAQAES